MDQLADGCWHGAIWAKNSDSMEQGSFGHCVQQTNIFLTHHLGHMQLWPKHVETSWSSSVKQSFVRNLACFFPMTYQYGTSQRNTLHSLMFQQPPIDVRKIHLLLIDFLQLINVCSWYFQSLANHWSLAFAATFPGVLPWKISPYQETLPKHYESWGKS